MKRVLWFSLVCILPSLCLAQNPPNHRVPMEVRVLEATWHPSVDRRHSTAVDPGSRLEQRRANNQLGPIDTEQALYLRSGRNAAVVVIRNDGLKTIKAISYDFIFVNTESGKEWYRYQFRNRVTIGAGETKISKNHVVSRRLETHRPLRVNPSNGFNSEIRVVIKRIEYTDGSDWRIR